jgi:hypothetical protein
MEALIARCLTDPCFLESAIQNPAAVSGQLNDALRAAALQMDFQKLWRFSGFIGKVQHNYLWEHFPMTRRLLWKLSIEHDVFGKYRKVQLSPSHGTLDRPSKVRRFAEFFVEFLDEYTAGARDLPLRSVFLHERIVWELRTAGDGPTSQAGESRTVRTWAEFARGVPAIASNVRVASFAYDPLRAAPNMRRNRTTLAYVKDSDGKVRVLVPDPLSAVVLSAIDGGRSVGSLVARIRRAGFREISPPAFRPLFEQAAGAGLIEWSDSKEEEP